MKHQTFFSSKDSSKIIKVSSVAIESKHIFTEFLILGNFGERWGWVCAGTAFHHCETRVVYLVIFF